MAKTPKPARESAAADTPTEKAEPPVCILLGDTVPAGFPAEARWLAHVTPAVADALLKSGEAVRRATDRDRSIFARDPADATGWEPAPPAKPDTAPAAKPDAEPEAKPDPTPKTA